MGNRPNLPPKFIEKFENVLKTNEELIGGVEIQGKNNNYLFLTTQRIIRPISTLVKTGFISSKLEYIDDFSINLKDIDEIKKTYIAGPSVMVGMVQNYPVIEIKTNTSTYSFKCPMGINPEKTEYKVDGFIQWVSEELARIKPRTPKEGKDIPTLLKGYADLRDKGIITEHEFLKKKRELLG